MLCLEKSAFKQLTKAEFSSKSTTSRKEFSWCLFLSFPGKLISREARRKPLELPPQSGEDAPFVCDSWASSKAERV